MVLAETEGRQVIPPDGWWAEHHRPYGGDLTGRSDVTATLDSLRIPHPVSQAVSGTCGTCVHNEQSEWLSGARVDVGRRSAVGSKVFVADDCVAGRQVSVHTV